MPACLINAEVRAAAEDYRRRGYMPIPVPRVGDWKGCLLEGWQKLRPEVAGLPALFPERDPPLNIGLLLGEPSNGLVDVDLDCDEANAAAPHILPATGWISGRTSYPRSHWWYLVADPPQLAAETFADIDGTMLIELRSTGGQTVVPPGLHASGEQITWHEATQPAQADIAYLRMRVSLTAVAALLARHWPQTKNRQNAHLALAGGLNRLGVSVGDATSVSTAIAAATNDEEYRKRGKVATITNRKADAQPTTGWPTLARLLGPSGDAVVQLVLQWLGAKTNPLTPVRMLPPYQAFPVDCLPYPLNQFVREAALTLNCDPAYVALPTLAAVASVTGNTRRIELKRKWREPSVLWSVIVGDSGTLKSPACDLAMEALRDLEDELERQHMQAMIQFTLELAEYERAKEAAKKKGDPPPEKPEPPTEERISTNDATIEKLANLLADNPRGLLLLRDELAGWLGSFTRYKSQKGSTDVPQWLEMFRAGRMTVDRMNSGTTRIRHAAVSVCGSVQPGTLTRLLTAEFFESGLVSRLLLAMPPKRPKKWTDLDLSVAIEQAMAALMRSLWALDFAKVQGKPMPQILRLTPDAKSLWVRFYNEWGTEQVAVDGDLAAAFSKLEGYAARFALLHHVVTHVGRGESDKVPVKVESVQAGIDLARWFACETRRVYAMLAESDEERDARRLVEFIRNRGGRISVRELMRANNRLYPDRAAAEVALEGLVKSGHAQWCPSPAPNRRSVELSMTHDTHDNEPDGGADDDGDVHDTSRKPPSPDGGPGTDDTGSTSIGELTCDETLADDSAPSVMRVTRHASAENSGSGEAASSAIGTTVMQTGGVPYTLVGTASDLQMVLAALDQTKRVGLDLETTGLDPRIDRIRLLSLACDTVDDNQCVYLIDCFAVDPTPLWDALADKELVIHNAAFDLGFLARLGFAPTGPVTDTMLMSKVLTAGSSEKSGLADCCQRWLNRTVPKSEQTSDWGGVLSENQLQYAALDADVLAPLAIRLDSDLFVADLMKAVEIENRCIPAMVWMADHGVPFDVAAWTALSETANADATRLRANLDAVAPTAADAMFSSGWNWDSPAQVKEAFARCDIALDDTRDETLAAIDHPLVDLLRQYREASKRCTAYGPRWLEHVHPDGRVYPKWFQLGASSGRMSCSSPAMQQFPRGAYRRCIAAPPGRVLVKADYSQIELRIAAKITGDRALLEAYQRGEDLHTLTAKRVLGIEEVSKNDRQLAKALNFGLLYGMGAKGFREYAKNSYGVVLTEQQAQQYRQSFFTAYPGLAAWHRRVGNTQHEPTSTRTLTRRRVIKVEGFNEKLNLPVQGTGADGLKLALALLWERRDQVPSAFPVMAVHDEIVVEAAEADAECVATWLKAAMLNAMAPLIEPVPVEVEVSVAETWGGDRINTRSK